MKYMLLLYTDPAREPTPGTPEFQAYIQEFYGVTDRAKGFLQSAQTVAIRLNHQRITPEHILKALLEDSEGMAAGLIQRAGGTDRLEQFLNFRRGQTVDPLP